MNDQGEQLPCVGEFTRLSAEETTGQPFRTIYRRTRWRIDLFLGVIQDIVQGLVNLSSAHSSVPASSEPALPGK